MPRHEALTANVQRTTEELVRIRYSLGEIDTVIDGYPELDERLYVPLDEQLPTRPSVILGREVRIYDIPSGHDASDSNYRWSTLNSVEPEAFLYGTPDPDRPTGGDWRLEEDHPTVVRALRDRCRDFTQHLQPLVPGWKELLALQTDDGRGLGMPTGIGWYTHYWLSDMCDATTARLSKNGDDIEVLLYPRREDPQSHAVWATPGGYVIKADTTIPGVTPLQAASSRRTKHWAHRDVMHYPGVPLRVKYPISSGNTIVAGLRTTPFARFVPWANYGEDPTVPPRARNTDRVAGFVSLRQLAEYNPTGGSSGADPGENPFPIWTTHFEYVVAMLDALIDPENQFRFRMNHSQFARVQDVAADLQANYPMLQPV